MSERPTPETDAVYENAIIKAAPGDFLPIATAMLKQAKKLEREMEEMRERFLNMEFSLSQERRMNAEHEQDYLAVWKAIKQPNESVIEALYRVLKERDEAHRGIRLMAQNAELWKERAEEAREALKSIANWEGGLGVKWPHEIARDFLARSSKEAAK